MYTANNKPFNSFFAAIAEAQTVRGNVTLTSDGSVKWSPGKMSAPKRRHVLVNADGTTQAFSKVRQ